MKKVALLIDPAKGYGRAFLRGIAEYLKAYDFWMCNRDIPYYFQPQKQKKRLLRLKDWGADGIITQETTTPELLALGIPVISTSNQTHPNFATIVSDNIKIVQHKLFFQLEQM